MYKLYTFFVGCNALVLPLQHFTFVLTQIVLTTMKRMLNRMLRYADAIVKRGVDKLIDAIGHSPEPQTKNAETPQPQKRMGNDTDCGITLMDEQCDISYNVLDRTPEVHPSRKNAWATTPTAHCKQLATLRTAVLPLWTNCTTFAIMCLTARPKCNSATKRTKGLCP